jgi:hypothetical protein
MINTVASRVSRLVGLKQHSGANNNNIANYRIAIKEYGLQDRVSYIVLGDIKVQ